MKGMDPMEKSVRDFIQQRLIVHNSEIEKWCEEEGVPYEDFKWVFLNSMTATTFWVD